MNEKWKTLLTYLRNYKRNLSLEFQSLGFICQVSVPLERGDGGDYFPPPSSSGSPPASIFDLFKPGSSQLNSLNKL